jgi:tripartite-type tricarboxylate transporter receptor subunit TctC
MRAHFTRRRALAMMGLSVPAAAFGATYPDRQIKLIVALAAGGPADTAARVFAPHFSQALGQSVFIENRSGASSVIGTGLSCERRRTVTHFYLDRARASRSILR